MYNFPVQILFAEPDRDSNALIQTLIAQIPENPCQLDVVHHSQALLDAIAERSHEIYLIDYSIAEEIGWDLLYQTIQTHAPLAVLLLIPAAVSDWPVNRLDGITSLDPAHLTPAIFQTILQNTWEQSQCQSQLNYLAQENEQLLQAVQTLRQHEERYLLAFQGLNDGIWDWNLIKNEITFSIEWQRMLGYPEHEVSCHPQVWFERIHPEDLYWVKQSLTAHLEGKQACFESKYRILHQDGNYCWMLARGQAIRNSLGEATRMVGIQTNITTLKKAEEKLVQDTLYDSLTGLPNRVSFMELLRRAGELATHRPEYLFAVLFIDLDRFKTINDSLGHEIGDQLLNEIAARLAKCLRPQDTIARLGGDEFVIRPLAN